MLRAVAQHADGGNEEQSWAAKKEAVLVALTLCFFFRIQHASHVELDVNMRSSGLAWRRSATHASGAGNCVVLSH